MHFEYDLFHILNLVFSYYFIFNCVLHCGALLQQSRVPDQEIYCPFYNLSGYLVEFNPQAQLRQSRSFGPVQWFALAHSTQLSALCQFWDRTSSRPEGLLGSVLWEFAWEGLLEQKRSMAQTVTSRVLCKPGLYKHSPLCEWEQPAWKARPQLRHYVHAHWLNLPSLGMM